jgi:SAM-dependent methyltransferase
MQKGWYLKLYGFASEKDFSEYLQTKNVIYDAGCGLGYKAAWLAELAPESIVIGMDFSNAEKQAAKTYKHIDNLYFIQGDIASKTFIDGAFDYVSCDQVIMHTENPDNTFAELTRITKDKGEFSCYVYAKKALPRELLDDYLRVKCKELSHDDLKQLSRQLSEPGKTLSDLKINIDVPDIPLMDIKGGTYDLQRVIYWNFIKCFWNADLGHDASVMTNYDWYFPSNAKRYSEDEFKDLIAENHLLINYFHKEEDCYSGRFEKTSGNVKENSK